MSASRPTVFLHVGAMKTGTTFLQHKLIANRESVGAQGVRFPGRTWSQQVRAAQDLLDLGRRDPQIASVSEGAWDALVAEVLAPPAATSVVSMEFLSFARPAHAARAAASFTDADLHVVLTIRDAGAIIPAQWQTSVTSGATNDWRTFQRGVRRSSGLTSAIGRLTRDEPRRLFREAQDISRILGVWSKVVPPERLHVITVPLPGAPPDTLWERFCSVVGLDPAPLTAPPKQTNESLGYASTELVRRINVALDLDSPMDHNKTVKDTLAHAGLGARRSIEERARLDRATYEFSLAWNRRVRDAVAASGVHVVGSLDELPVANRDTPHVTIEEEQRPPTDKELLAAGRDAYHAMRALVQKRSRRLRKKEMKPRSKRVLRRLVRPGHWGESASPVEAAVADLAALSRLAIDQRRRLRGVDDPS